MHRIIVANRRGHQVVEWDIDTDTQEARERIAEAERILQEARQRGCVVSKKVDGKLANALVHGTTREVRRDAGKRDDDVTAAYVAIIPRIHRNRLRSAEDESHHQERDEGHHDREDRVDVLQRIERHAPELLGRRVSLFERRVRMCVLVRHHREEDDRGEQEEPL